MHYSVQNLINIKNKLKETNQSYHSIKIIAVSKTFPFEKISPLIDYGHLDFGENKVQEAIEKWSKIKLEKKEINLHLIGKLQTNKVKFAVKIFDYIHSLDSLRLAKKIAQEEIKQGKKIKIFIQVNLANEEQKSGIPLNQLDELYNYSLSLNLNIIGLMCIPPELEDPKNYFIQLKKLNDKLRLNELSMGMSADFMKAADNKATFIRIGSKIFGSRS
jgi:pyridoxal phosphate enzyme (YggS family)